MMKSLRLLRKVGLILACSGLFSAGVVQAQTVITVEPGLNTLSDALTANPGATLILQREGDYAVTGTMVINVPTIIKGETEPADARPAVISYSALPGEGQGKDLFQLGASCTFQNFGVIGYTDDGQQIGNIFSAKAPDISITIDGCNIQGAFQVLSTGQDGLTIVMKNNTMYNICGTVWDNWCGFGSLWGNAKGDFKSFNNTIFTAGRIFNFGGGGPDGSEAMEHNSYVNCWGDTYYPIYNEKVSVKNNIFFNTQLRAYVDTILGSDGSVLWVGDFTDWQAKEIPVSDQLAGDCPVFINKADTLADGTPNPVHRAVNINNNLKFYDKTVLDFYAANKIITKQPFMPKTMKEVFAPKYGWNIAGNMLEEEGKGIDPKFEMGALPAAAFDMAFKTRLNRHLPTAEADPDFPFEIAWRPGGEERGEFIWPMPFNFKPTNAAISTAGTDGYPLGDLNWYGKDVVAAWEAGKPNPAGGAPTSEIKKVTGTPAVDGTVNTFWADVQANVINKPFTGEAPTVEATWKAVWNDDGIFVLVEVADDIFSPAYEGTDTKTWNYDHPEIYFDVNAVLKDGKGTTPDANGGGNGHYQFDPGFVKGNIDGGAPGEKNGGKFSFKVTGSNYVGEYFVPFTKLLDKDKKAMDKTIPIGFDVYICDADLKSGDRRRQVWSNVGAVNEAWITMDDCGTITLSNTVIADVTSVRNLNESKQTAYIANDMLRFKGFDKAVDAEVYSILGQKLLIAKNINEINVSSLKPGIYLVKVNDNQAFRVVK